MDIVDVGGSPLRSGGEQKLESQALTLGLRKSKCQGYRRREYEV